MRQAYRLPAIVATLCLAASALTADGLLERIIEKYDLGNEIQAYTNSAGEINLDTPELTLRTKRNGQILLYMPAPKPGENANSEQTPEVALAKAKNWLSELGVIAPPIVTFPNSRPEGDYVKFRERPMGYGGGAVKTYSLFVSSANGSITEADISGDYRYDPVNIKLSAKEAGEIGTTAFNKHYGLNATVSKVGPPEWFDMSGQGDLVAPGFPVDPLRSRIAYLVTVNGGDHNQQNVAVDAENGAIMFDSGQPKGGGRVGAEGGPALSPFASAGIASVAAIAVVFAFRQLMRR